MSGRASKKRTRKWHRHRSYHLPFGYRVRRQALFRFLFVFSLFAITFILLFFAFQHYLLVESQLTVEFSEAEASPVSTPRSTDSSSVLTDGSDKGDKLSSATEVEVVSGYSLQSILETYRTATGLHDVRSLLLHGEYVEDGRRFEMKLAAKAPELVRKTLSDDKMSMICSYDGKVATVHVEQGAGQSVSQTLEDVLYQKAIILEGAFLSLADIGTELLRPRHSWQPDQTYEGKTCWTIASQLSGSSPIHHLIDPDSGYERARYLEVTVEGTRHQISMHFTDYRASGGHTLPHAYTLKVNGTPRGSARIDSVQSNQGLMPWMFSDNAQ